MPDVRQALIDQGIEAAPSSPAQFSAYIKSETAKWRKVIQASGLK
jgi:tripartite-type tricarboxylate transporter receptor subunit TctC